MISHLRKLALAGALGLVAAALPGTGAHADPGRHHDEDHHHNDRYGHDEVRAAVERGEIKPLAQLLDQVKGKLPGDITGVDIERRHGMWLYEFRVIDKAGRLFDVYVDAQSGEIRRTKEK